MLVGRCIQGIGGGGVIALTQVIFADIVPLRQRPKYFSLVLAAWALGTVLGPLLGGVFVQKASWKWVFWINLPFCGVGLVMVSAFVRLSTEKTSLKSKLLRVDWLGGFLFVGSMVTFLVGLSWGGVQYPWTSYHTLVPLIIGPCGIIVSLLWEYYGAREPFLRHTLFQEHSAIAAYLVALIQGLVVSLPSTIHPQHRVLTPFQLFCALYSLPLYFMAPEEYTPIAAGCALFAMSCLLLPGSAIVSLLITRLGRFRWAIWSGWAIATVGAGLFVLIKVHVPKGVWIAACMVFGLGQGMILSSINFAIQAIVRPEDAGRGAAMYSFMRTLGMAIGVAVGGAVFTNTMSAGLSDHNLPTQIAQDAVGYIPSLKATLAADPSKLPVAEAYVRGVKGVFIMLTAVSALALLLSLCIKKFDMDKILESKYTLETKPEKKKEEGVKQERK